MERVKQGLKGALRGLGLDVRLVRNVEQAAQREWVDRWRQEWRFVQAYPIRTILDVGANTGQFAAMIHRVIGLPSGTDAFVDDDGHWAEGVLNSLAAVGLLQSNPNPTREEARLAMSGNLCRCGAYDNYLNGVMRAAGSRA